jgi:hypothetical protein
MKRFGVGTMLAALMLAALLAGQHATVAAAGDKLSKAEVREICLEVSISAKEYYESKNGGYGCRFTDGTSLDCTKDQSCKFNDAKPKGQTSGTSPDRIVIPREGQVITGGDETRAP